MNVYLVMFRVGDRQWCEGVFSSRENAEIFLKGRGFKQTEEAEDGYFWVYVIEQAYIDERQVI